MRKLLRGLLFCVALFLMVVPTAFARQGIGPATTLMHNSDVIGVEWSADGSRVLTWTSTTLTIWDATTGAPLTELNAPQSTEFALVEWLPDVERLLTASYENQLTVWDSTTATPIWQMEGEVFFDWDTTGNNVLTIKDGIARHHNVEGVLMAETETPSYVGRMSPRGDYSLVGNQILSAYDGTIIPIDVPGDLISVDWSADGNTLLVATADGFAGQVDVATGEFLNVFTFELPAGGGIGFEYVAQGNLILGQIGRSTLTIWDNNGTELQTVTIQGTIISTTWNGVQLAFTYAGEQNHVVVVDAFQGQLADHAYSSELVDAQWTPGGNFLLARFFSNEVVLFNPITGAGVYAQEFGALPGIVWHPNELIFAARTGSIVAIFDLTPFAAPAQ